MRDINELIGIVKGVGFDGIINQAEILKLKGWIENNKDLVCDKKQADLISCIEKIIKKNTVNDEDRANLNRLCSSYLNEKQDSLSKVYELYGIVEGIISDSVVNEYEIENLRHWLNNYGDLISDNKQAHDLMKKLDAIVAMKTIPDEKQRSLLSEVSHILRDAQIMTKLNYLKILIRRRTNIGLYLLDLLDNPDFIAKIHDEAENQLRNSIRAKRLNGVDDSEIVFISLVLIAMLEYDGNFFFNVHKTYSRLYKLCRVEQTVDGLIRTIIDKYRNSTSKLTSNSRKISLILSNSIVPYYYLGAFFEFIFDIYSINFNCCLSNDLISDFEFVYDGLRNVMQSEGDTINSKTTKKTYKLIKTTKELIAGNALQLQTIIRFSIIIANVIDKYYWNKDIKIVNPYLKHGFEEWVSILDKKKIMKGEYQTCIGNATRSRWEPKFFMHGDEVFLIPPKHWIKSNYDCKKIKAIVMNNDELLFEDERPIIREIFGGYEIEIKEVKLDKPLGCVYYKLLCGNETIYDSKEVLFRDFIVFNVSGAEIPNNTEYVGEAIICYKKTKIENFLVFNEHLYYRTTQLNIKKGDVVYIDDKIFNFSSMIEPGICGEKRNNHYVKRKNSKILIPVYFLVKTLIFECENEIDNIEIIINDKRKKIDDFKYAHYSREGIDKYVVELNEKNSGIYSLAIYGNNGGRKNISSFEYAIDSELNIETFPITFEQYMVSVNTSLTESQISKKVDLKTFDVNFIEFEYGSETYIYYIPFDFNIFRIDNNTWAYLGENLWIGDIKLDSELEIFNSEIKELEVYSDKNEQINNVCKLKSNGISTRTPIGFLRTYKNNYPFVYLRFKKDGVCIKELICYNNCILNESRTNISFDPITKVLEILPYFNGKGKLYISILNEKNKEIFKSDILENEKSVEIKGLVPFRKYSILFKEKEGFIDRIIAKFERSFFAVDAMEGRLFKIDQVNYDLEINNKLDNRSMEFRNVYVFFEKRIDQIKYTGKVCFKLRSGVTIWQNNINPVEIIICSGVINNTVELALNKDGDGLLLDIKRHGVLDNLDDLNAPDIYSYLIDIKGVKQDE